jgi:stage II sporulation protein P
MVTKMSIKFKNKNLKIAVSYVPGIIRLFLLSCIMIVIGIFSGSILSNIDVNKILQTISLETYKSVLNNSMPIIDTVYNNGSASNTTSFGINDVVNNLFGFNIDNPISILNAQSPLMNSYYTHNYVDLNQKKINDVPNDVPNDVQNNVTDNNSNSKIIDNPIPADKGNGGLEEAASSISTDEGNENKQPSQSDIVSSGKITIKNETKNKVNIDQLLNQPLNFVFNKKTDKVLIYHTHTTESYIRDISQLNSSVVTRTTDPRYSIVRVGEELAQNFKKTFGIQVIHNATIHDYPDYNYAYNNSFKTVSTILNAYPSIKIVIDMHRDAAGDTKKLRNVATVNGKKAAKIMFVVATGEQKQNHPNWKENLKLALKIQQKLLVECPAITQSIDLSPYRYNQNLSKGALLIEIGGDGNLLSECLESTKYLAKAINSVISK